jgi:hypothetical protein
MELQKTRFAMPLLTVPRRCTISGLRSALRPVVIEQTSTTGFDTALQPV